NSYMRRRSVGDIDSFVRLLMGACEDDAVAARLESILTMPDAQRRAFLHKLLNDLMVADAPTELLEALACLTDDAVAEKAYEVVAGFRGTREPNPLAHRAGCRAGVLGRPPARAG